MNDKRDAVREAYGKIGAAKAGGGCCEPGSCGGGSSALGYSKEEAIGKTPGELFLTNEELSKFLKNQPSKEQNIVDYCAILNI